MAAILTIAGQTIDRVSTRTTLNRLRVGLDSPDELEWTQSRAPLVPAWTTGQSVALELDGSLVFSGVIVSIHPGRDTITGGIVVGYRALGYKYLANTIPITNPNDLSGRIVFNLPSDDPNYVADQSGLSVGEMLSELFTGNAAALTGVGITGFNATDLQALTVVPPVPVVLQGSKFWNAVEDLINRWCNQYVAAIPANGTIRVFDSTALPSFTLTLDEDPIDIENISRDTTDCATRVIVRGTAEVEPAYLSLSDGTLAPAFSATEIANWNYYDFSEPQGAVDDGVVTALASTQATIQSNDSSTTWGVNYWSNIDAWIFLINPVATGIAQIESRRVTANTALTAGSTSTLTFDRPLVNGGYTKYHIVGQPAGESQTWRLYNIVNTYIAQHLVNKFPAPVPWRAGESIVLTNYPASSICYSPSGQPPYLQAPATFEVMIATGQIQFSEPVVRIFGTLANLELGGSNTDGIPNDILILVPYSRGALSTQAPATGYSGTAYTVDGIERTLYVDVPTWINPDDQSSMTALAEATLATVQDAVVEGSILYDGKYSQALTVGQAVSIAGNGYTTGWENLKAPIRGCELVWPRGGATSWATRLEFSTRRRPFIGDRLYIHPAFTGGAAWDVRASTIH